jgi:oligopeptide/dipeptide ABC transporter ATP-binding protein
MKALRHRSPNTVLDVAGDEPAMPTVLDVRNLTVSFSHATRNTVVRAVNGVSFELQKGRILAILGESGSGKSVLLRTILGLQASTARVSGEVIIQGTNVLDLPPAELANMRGDSVSMVFQNPMTALDPVFTVEQQIVETVRRHKLMSKDQARARALELLRLVQIDSPERRLRAYPFELSGGMRQRVVIAMALACNPQLLLADEPTTALDVTVQARVLDLLRSIRDEFDTSIILVTHDVAVAAEIADDVLVMYAGRVVESGPASVIIHEPQHPYTRGLLRANVGPGQTQRPVAIPGMPPNPAHLPNGCAFAPRCPEAFTTCREAVPELLPVGALHYARCALVDAPQVSSARRSA